MTEGFKVGSLVVAASTLFLTLGYYAGNQGASALRDQLGAYEKSEKFRLPEILQSIGSATSRLEKDLAHSDEISQLKNNLQKCEGKLVEKDGVIEKLQEKAKIADRLFPTNELFQLNEGNSTIFGGFDVIIGLISLSDAAYNMPAQAALTINNQRTTLSPGQFAEVTSRGKPCRIVFTKLIKETDWPHRLTGEFQFVVTGGAQPDSLANPTATPSLRK
jgi:hypothetical protein